MQKQPRIIQSAHQSKRHQGTAATHKLRPTSAGATQHTEKVLITGDDILIEYVSRLLKQLSQGEDRLPDAHRQSITKFITHYVWHSKDAQTGELSTRLSERLSEMLERRRRLIKYLFKKENNLA